MDSRIFASPRCRSQGHVSREYLSQNYVEHTSNSEVSVSCSIFDFVAGFRLKAQIESAGTELVVIAGWSEKNS